LTVFVLELTAVCRPVKMSVCSFWVLIIPATTECVILFYVLLTLLYSILN
jgi:hypothetical protein